jgi:hypothetical protein
MSAMAMYRIGSAAARSGAVKACAEGENRQLMRGGRA